ncbi:MAG: ThiF family adenylyltransferase [Deltaproteobacteria bacterium]|nr:ThiF family adenylyltransferase [Deltaproteobacteria bacterium]
MKNRADSKTIGELRVALAGLGGVGGYCARILHACGVRQLIASDYDVFQPKNISYQFFASPRTVARNKTDVVQERLAQWTDSPTRVETLQGDLTQADAVERLIDRADIVVSALDNFAAQSAVGMACERAKIPFAMVSAMGFCSQYTVYLPDASHSYSSAWKHFSRGPGQRPAKAGDPEIRRMMALQSVLFAVALAGYTEEAIREMLECFQRDDVAQFLNISCIGYSAAALGVLNALKYLTGEGRAAVFPEVVSFDMKEMRSFDGRQIIARVGELNRAWRQGTEAVLACVRRWRNSE